MNINLKPAGLRILMVTPRYFPEMGGVETHVAEVSQRLVQRGLDVTILTTDRRGSLPAEELQDGLRIVRVKAWPAERDYHFAPGMLNYIRRGSWDVMHLQSYHTLVAPLAMAAARMRKLPYVVTFHGGGNSSQLRNNARPLQMALLRPLLAHAARLVAIARFEIEQYSQTLHVPHDRFTLIPNGVDFGRTIITKGAVEPGFIVAVGRLERYKGHQRLLSAMPQVLATAPHARLRIVGAGPYESELRRLTAELKLEDKVEIGPIPPTNREGMATVLGQAALVALMSDYETHPIAALEALSLGKPVLATYTSGLGELADRGLISAVPLSAGSDEISQAMLAQLEHPHQPPQLELPTWDACAEGLHALYESVKTSITTKAHFPC